MSTSFSQLFNHFHKPWNVCRLNVITEGFSCLPLCLLDPVFMTHPWTDILSELVSEAVAGAPLLPSPPALMAPWGPSHVRSHWTVYVRGGKGCMRKGSLWE